MEWNANGTTVGLDLFCSLAARRCWLDRDARSTKGRPSLFLFLFASFAHVGGSFLLEAGFTAVPCTWRSLIPKGLFLAPTQPQDPTGECSPQFCVMCHRVQGNHVVRHHADPPADSVPVLKIVSPLYRPGNSSGSNYSNLAKVIQDSRVEVSFGTDTSLPLEVISKSAFHLKPPASPERGNVRL